MKNLLILSLFTALAASANAQQIADRTTLNSLLVSSTTDDFESYSLVPGDADLMGTATLDSTTVVNSQGPGLVNPGATYSGSSLQWNGDQYFGQSTQTILSNSQVLRIDYAGGTDAMGLDARSFSGFAYSGTIDIMSGATLLGSISFGVGGNAGDSTFLGWQSTSPITHVLISSTDFSWSPIIDDHTYGSTNSVPEPASLAVLGLGALVMVRRRRK